MGGGDAAGPTGTPAGRQASKEPAAGGCPAPLLRPSHKGAQGPRFLLAPPSRPGPVGSAPVAVARAGLWAAAPAGVVWPGRVSLTHWLRCPSSPRLDRITSGGESPTSLGRAGWRWGRALLGETAGTVSGRGYGLGKGPLLGPPESPFSARSPAAAVSAADAADSPTPTSRKPLRVSADPSPA